MNTKTASLNSTVNSVNGHAPHAQAIWAATIEAEVEPALLSRVLQRLMVQGVVIDTLRYDADVAEGNAQLEILFHSDEEHARLLAKRWQTIVTVQRVALCQAQVCRRLLRKRPRMAEI